MSGDLQKIHYFSLQSENSKKKENVRRFRLGFNPSIYLSKVHIDSAENRSLFFIDPRFYLTYPTVSRWLLPMEGRSQSIKPLKFFCVFSCFLLSYF